MTMPRGYDDWRTAGPDYPCPDCDGTGETWWVQYDFVNRETTSGEEPCARCHGSGRVEEPDEEEE